MSTDAVGTDAVWSLTKMDSGELKLSRKEGKITRSFFFPREEFTALLSKIDDFYFEGYT